MRQASTISVGMPSANCFKRNTPKGQPTMGKITARMVSYRPRADISRQDRPADRDVLFQEYRHRNRDICEDNIQSIASALSGMHL